MTRSKSTGHCSCYCNPASAFLYDQIVTPGKNMVVTPVCTEILFIEGAHRVDLVQLKDLFDRCAFWAQGRSLDDIALALSNSEPVITLWQDGRLIGHGRATSDGIYRAMIWDVVIDQQFQGWGLGKRLMQTILAHPKICSVERVYLMTTHQQEFYLRLGFDLNLTTTMIRQRSG